MPSFDEETRRRWMAERLAPQMAPRAIEELLEHHINNLREAFYGAPSKEKQLEQLIQLYGGVDAFQYFLERKTSLPS